MPIGHNVLFHSGKLTIGIEICEDMWTPYTPGTRLALYGAQIIFNLSASNELAGKNTYLRSLISGLSSQNLCGYVYASAGYGESSTDTVFTGKGFIAEVGKLLIETPRFTYEERLIISDIDVMRIDNDRLTTNSFNDSIVDHTERGLLTEIPFRLRTHEESHDVDRKIEQNPFLPDALGLPREGIIAVTMPGLGTSDHTKNNAIELMAGLGVTSRTIDITEACMQHFAAIGHDPEVQDVVFENTQARERTQILMDLANKYNAPVIGTGDLSELALGWCTFNGDHMSMYSVNAGIPKTAIQIIVSRMAEIGKFGAELSKVLRSVVDTPISPELKPTNAKGDIDQKTEDVVGPYELHDFFLYNFLGYGYPPQKIFYMAKVAFKDKYDAKSSPSSTSATACQMGLR